MSNDNKNSIDIKKFHILAMIDQSENQKNKPNKPPNQKVDMIDWWAGTVLLTFFPILISLIVDLLRNGAIDLNRMIGNGELILSAFLVITPSIMNFYKTHSNQEDATHKRYFIILLFDSFFLLIAYIFIKTTLITKEHVVYITSALCVPSSVVIAWKGEKFLKKVNKT